MLRRFRVALGMAAVLAAGVGEARAQYYPGYGAFGWGGWGGSSTAQGDIARGLGYYDMEVGALNEENAVANSINANTVMRWNQYLYLSQQEANRREYLRRARRQQRDSQTGDLVYKRLRDNPTPRDIEEGDALNVVLDQITDPRIHSSALRLASDPIPKEVIKDIPFENASEAVTLSLNQLSAKGAWPPALEGERFAEERAAYQEAIEAALKEDEEGQISPATLSRVRATISRLRAKLAANRPADRVELGNAENYIKTLYGMARMLEKPSTEKILAELQKVEKTTLGSLLGFMHTYNLRFGPATTADQRAVYEKLYPILVAHRDKIVKDAGLDNTPGPQAKGYPTDFFQGMHLDHLEGKRPAGRSPQ